SNTTNVTFSATSQSRSSSNPFVVVAKVRISCRRDRRPLGFGIRTHALRSFFPISNPAHRSCNNSTTPTPRPPTDPTRARPEGPQGQRIWSACSRQQSTVPVGGPQRHTDSTSSQASQINRRPGRTRAPISRLHGGPAQQGTDY